MKTHGMFGTRVYVAWCAMRWRCNPRHPQSKDYSERGISCCERWSSFENFYSDMGDIPEGMTLDRIDNDQGYSPANCRWASRKTQGNNTRKNVFVEFRGERRSLSDWAQSLNLKYSTLYDRISVRGWTIDDALTTATLPSRKGIPNSMRKS